MFYKGHMQTLLAFRHYKSLTQWLSAKQPLTTCKWLWLCSNKTLLTNTTGGPDWELWVSVYELLQYVVDSMSVLQAILVSEKL